MFKLQELYPHELENPQIPVRTDTNFTNIIYQTAHFAVKENPPLITQNFQIFNIIQALLTQSINS